MSSMRRLHQNVRHDLAVGGSDRLFRGLIRVGRDLDVLRLAIAPLILRALSLIHI